MAKPTSHSSANNPIIRTPLDLGAAIRAGRKHTGLTLEMAALQLGMAKQTLNDIELGRPTVGIGLVMHAATQFGVVLYFSGRRYQTRILDNWPAPDP